jgi:stage II sporulation protein E
MQINARRFATFREFSTMIAARLLYFFVKMLGMTKQKTKHILGRILMHILICAVLVVFSYSNIDGISPFAAAFLFCLASVPVVKVVPAAVLILTELAKQPTRGNIIGTLSGVALFALSVVLLSAVKIRGAKKSHLPILLTAFVLSQGFNIYDAITGDAMLSKALIAVIVGSVFLSAVFVSVAAVKQKRFSVPWTTDQIICLMAVVVIFALGLSGFNGPYFDVHKFFTVLIILISVFYADPKSAVMLAAAFGLGRAFVALDLTYVAIFTLLAISCVSFKSRNRAYSITALIFTDLVIGFYFGGYADYNGYSLLPILAAVGIFLVLPKSFSRIFTFGAGGIGGFLVSKNTINRNTAGISARMRSLSAVFNEMQNTYRNLTHSALPPNETAVMLCGDITAAICGNCPNKGMCRRTTAASKDVEDGITSAAKTALKKGQVSLLDIPNTLSIKCTRINTLLGAINKAVVQNKNKEQIIAGLDSGKILMANLLSGVSQLCAKFADDVCRSVVFDTERADLVKEELLYKNIVAEDCLITKTGKNEFVVSVLIPRADAGNRQIEKVVSCVCGHKMVVDEVADADTKGFAIVSVRSAPRYGILFGVATVAKGVNEKNGDTFSFLRVTNDKTLMALCDGMGAGERASKASTLALSLVENFYKAGFPDEIIMHSVNQLLSFTGQDIFSALDICVFDLSMGDTDFIKVGAADGFIKREREVEVVEAGSLPLGILDDIEPKITRAVLTAGDTAVLCSDGVLDSFNGDRVVLAGFINNLDTKSPQELADKIIAETITRSNKSPADDCTVTVAKIITL